MKNLTRLITAAAFAAVASTTAFAAGEALEPNAKARMELMKTVGGATKTLGGMAGEKVAFDSAAAEAAKAALIAAASDIPAKFEAQTSDPASEAKPEIWTNWDDFVAKGAALKTAAEAMDATTLEGVKAGMAAVGGTCKDCHSSYRM